MKIWLLSLEISICVLLLICGEVLSENVEECLSIDKLCESCPSNNIFAHRDSEKYLDELTRTFAKFDKATGRISEDTLFQAYYGPPMTYKQHMEWMVDHIAQYTSEEAPGFHKTGERNGVEYEMHDKLTARYGGYGYFRFTGEVSISQELFTALLMDAQANSQADETIRLFAPLKEFEDKQTWLVYWRSTAGNQ